MEHTDIRDDDRTWLSGVWSISELAGECSSALDTLEKRFDSWSSIPDSEASTIKSIGPLLIGGKDSWMVADEKVMTWGNPLPSFVFTGLYNENPPEMRGGQAQEWTFIYCARQHSLPLGVVPTGPGWAYTCSVWMAWKESEEASNIGGYFTVDPSTGMVHPCCYHTQRWSRVKKKGRKGWAEFNQPVWMPDKLWTARPDKGSMTLLEMVVSGFNAELARDQHWRLIVERRTEEWKEYPLRCCALIDPTTVTRLFKDRDKVEYAVAKSGKRRPILHWAKAHFRKQYEKPRNWWERILWKFFPRLRRVKKVSTVRTHLRGMKDFELNGVECSLQVPGLHAAAHVDNRPLVSFELDEAPIKERGDIAIRKAAVPKDDPVLPKHKPKWYGKVPMWGKTA